MINKIYFVIATTILLLTQAEPTSFASCDGLLSEVRASTKALNEAWNHARNSAAQNNSILVETPLDTSNLDPTQEKTALHLRYNWINADYVYGHDHATEELATQAVLSATQDENRQIEWVNTQPSAAYGTDKPFRIENLSDSEIRIAANVVWLAIGEDNSPLSAHRIRTQIEDLLEKQRFDWKSTVVHQTYNRPFKRRGGPLMHATTILFVDVKQRKVLVISAQTSGSIRMRDIGR